MNVREQVAVTKRAILETACTDQTEYATLPTHVVYNGRCYEKRGYGTGVAYYRPVTRGKVAPPRRGTAFNLGS